MKLVSRNGPSAGNALRDHDAVDPDLYVGVFAAHVKAGIGNGGVVGHARHLQDDFVDRRIVGLRQVLDGVASNGVSRCAEFRQEILVARLIEPGHLGVESSFGGSRRINCGCGSCRRLWRPALHGLGFLLWCVHHDLRQLGSVRGGRGRCSRRGRSLLRGGCGRGRLRGLLLRRRLLILRCRWLWCLRTDFMSAGQSERDGKGAGHSLTAKSAPQLLRTDRVRPRVEPPWHSLEP